MAEESNKIEIEITGDPKGFISAIASAQASFSLFAQNLATNTKIWDSFISAATRGSENYSIEAKRAFESVGKAVGLTGATIRKEMDSGFKSVVNSSDVAANTLKRHFVSSAIAAGATAKQAEDGWKKSLGKIVITSDDVAKQQIKLEELKAAAAVRAAKKVEDATNRLLERNKKRQAEFAQHEKDITANVERESAKRIRITEQEIDKQRRARHGALSTLAHSLPFGVGRTAAFSALNLGDMAGGEGTGALAGISSFVSKVPVPVILAIATAFTTVTAAVNAAKSAVMNFVVPAIAHGLKYLDLIENTKLGFAGLLMTMTELTSNGEPIKDQAQQWEAAVTISERITVQLQNAALKTKAVYADLARGMQEGLGPMLQGGVTENEITPFVTRFIHTMSALRIPLREIGQEIRAFFNLETNPRTARASFVLIGQAAAQMGISFDEAKKKLQELKSQGKLDDWFLENSEGMRVAGEAAMKTLSGYVSNLTEIFDRLMGEGVSNLYLVVIDALEGITDAIGVLDEQGNLTLNQNLLEGIRKIADISGVVVNEMLKWLPVAVSIAEQYLKLAGYIADFAGWLYNIQLLKYDNLKTIKDALTFATPDWLNKLVDVIYNSDFAKNFRKYGKDIVSGTATTLGLVGSSSKISNLYQNPIGPELNYGYNGRLERGPIGPATFNEDEKSWAEFQSDAFKENLKRLEKSRKESEQKLEKSRREAEQIHLEWVMGTIKFYEKWGEIEAKLYDSFVTGGNKWKFGQYNLDRVIQGTSAAPEFTDSTGKVWPATSGKEGVMGYNARTLPSWFDESTRNIRNTFGNEAKYEAQRQLMERNAEVFNKEIDQYWRGPMKSIFAELGTTGGKNFMQVVAGNFDRMVSDSVDKLVDLYSGKDMRVEPIKDAAGNITGYNYFQGNNILSETEFKKQQSRQSKFNMGMAAFNVGMGSYAAGRSGQSGSITSGIIGGAVTGYSMAPGTVLGAYAAIAGAIIGGIAAAMGKAAARDEYKFGVPRLDEKGKFSFSGKNINKAEAEEMQTRLQETFDKFWNGYMRLAVEYGAKILPDLAKMAGAKWIQPEASKNFLKHFEEFLAGLLPDAIADEFYKPLEDIAINLGMSKDRFAEIFHQFDSLNPTKALELLGIVFQTLKNFQTVRNFTEGTPALGLNYFNQKVEGHGISMRQQSYASTFVDAQVKMLALGDAIKNLTGEDQIRAAHELSNTLIDMMERQNELARQFAAFLLDSSRTFGALRRSLTIEGMGSIETDENGNTVFKPDYEKQMQAEQDYLQDIMNNIATAGTLEELQYWQSEAMATMQRIGAIAQQGGPEMYEAYRDWMIGEDGKSGVLGTIQAAIAERVEKWGDEVGTATNQFMAKMQPYIDAFNTTLNKITIGTGGGPGGGLDGFGGGIEEVIPILSNFGTALKDVIPILEDIAALEFGRGGSVPGEEAETNDFRSTESFERRVLERRRVRVG